MEKVVLNTKRVPKPKLRVTLSVDLLEAIVKSTEFELFQNEINRTIGTALYRYGSGTTKPAYIEKPKTLEQLVISGEATKEEVAKYNKDLMDLL